MFERVKAQTRFYVRRRDRSLTFVERPYRNVSCYNILCSDRLILIGGGIRIIALVPCVIGHSNVVLHRRFKQSAHDLVEELRAVTKVVRNREVHIDSRVDTETVVRGEAGVGWKKFGKVASGPPKLCDDGARKIIRFVVKVDTRTETCLKIEAYSW